MSYVRHPIQTIKTPASGNASVTIYDNGRTSQDATSFGPSDNWVVLACLVDEACTLVQEWAPTVDSPDEELEVVSSGDAYTIAANAFYTMPIQLPPGRSRITVKAGATPPTPTLIAAERIAYPGLR